MGFDAREVRRWSAAWCAGTCCSPRSPPPATSRTRRPSRSSPSGSPTVETLDLLEALTEADARATSPQGVDDRGGPAWCADLGRRVRRELLADAGAGPGRPGDEPAAVDGLRGRARGPAAGSTYTWRRRGRRHGDGGLRRPDRADRRRRRRAGRAAGLGPLGPGLDAGRPGGLGVGRRRHPPRRGDPAPAARGGRRSGRLDPAPGCGRRATGGSSRRCSPPRRVAPGRP